jgi:hypothetical protein
MTRKEALELRALINIETRGLRVEINQIGNGECPLVINGYFSFGAMMTGIKTSTCY